MIDGSEKRNRQLAFELPNSHVCEKRQIIFLKLNLSPPIDFHSGWVIFTFYMHMHT